MNRLSVFFLFCISIFQIEAAQGQNLKSKADSLYFLPAPSERDDQEAIATYRLILEDKPNLGNIHAYISSAERLGNLYSVYGDTEAAIRSYRKGINSALALQAADTLLYPSHLYLGEALFAMSKIDSSVFHLKQAEMLQSKIQVGKQPERLYNALGVYYFETGNYLQSIRYFTQAEQEVHGLGGDYELYARYSFLSNQASALYHLERFDSAKVIYNELLTWDINPNEVLLNLANTHLQEGDYSETLSILEKINNPERNQVISYLNLKGRAHLELGAKNEVEQVLAELEDIFEQGLTREEVYEKGIFFDLKGKVAAEAGLNKQAVEFFHLAVVQLHPNFDEKDYWKNPSQVSFGMGAVRLFEALTQKGEYAWEQYLIEKSDNWFRLGLESYQAAFQLADYIKMNFDTDESRIFLGDQVLKAYQRGIDQVLNLANLRSDESLLALAFVWAEESKAGALRIAAQIKKTKQQAGIPRELLEEESNLEFLLSRNYQSQFKVEDLDELNRLKIKYTELQVQLSRLREKFRSYLPNLNTTGELVLEVFQEKLHPNQACISMFQSESQLLVFWIEQDFFDWQAIPLNEIDFDALETWRVSLQNFQRRVRYQPNAGIMQLSQKLFAPWSSRTEDLDQLLVIPHMKFSSLPFEVFPNEQGGYLIEKLAVSYQFSAALVVVQEQVAWKKSEVLGLAPYSNEGTAFFSPLIGSDIEVRQIGGEYLLGNEADLKTFLSLAPSYPYLHLATHAVAAPDDPNASFIAFYPEVEEVRLYNQELSNQNFDAVRLVFLSACDTGDGLLSSSEGLVSLARSFSLAGVDYLITSLWKTENQAAIYLSGAFYKYLEAGHTYDRALQNAKLDLLKDPLMAQYSDPAYWSNLILIGQPEKQADFRNSSLLVGILLILLMGLGFAYWYLKKR